MKIFLLGLLIACFLFSGFTLNIPAYNLDGGTEAVIHNCKTGSPVAMFELPEKYLDKDENLVAMMQIRLSQWKGNTVFSAVTDKLEITLPDLVGTYVLTITLGDYQVIKTITLQ